jgi:hypothetical protein
MPLDPNNQNYFSLGEQPVAPLPWWKVRKFQARLAGIAGVIVGVGVVGYYGYQTYTLTHVNVDALKQAETILSAAAQICADEKDPVACEAAARADAARETGEASVCEGLVESEYVNCVKLIAQDSRDADVCRSLSGDDEVACADSATLFAAQDASNYGMCEAIVDADMRASCQSQLLKTVIQDGECAKYGIADDVCGYPEKLAAIIATGDPLGCFSLPSEKQDGCSDMFSSLDQDRDGLTLLTESKLGTSDTSADTDGDGYTDSQEVASGNDPLK